MRNGSRTVLVAIVAGFTWGLLATSAGAATIAPTVFTDDITVNGNCTLREAVQATNTNADVDLCDHTGAVEPDTINLAGGTPYELTVDGANENSNQTGDLDVDLTTGSTLTIDGAGATATTINAEAGWADRILQRSGFNSLTVSDLTITDGNNALADPGGAIHSSAGDLVVERVRVTGNRASLRGGGISAVGSSLSVTDSTIDDNMDTGGVGGGGLYTNVVTTTLTRTVIRDNTATNVNVPEGGGFKAESTVLTMTDSLIHDNHLIDTDANGVIFGGGLQLLSSPATIRNSTISNNDMAGGVVEVGGGIQTDANLTLVNSTVSGNEALGAAPSDGGGLATNGGVANVIHTTFGTNAAADQGNSVFHNGGAGNLIVRGSVIETTGAGAACGGTAITSTDDNVFTDLTCGPETGNDDADANPQLLLLADNGGTDAGAPGSTLGLLTHAPDFGSTVIDHVPTGDCDDELAAPLLVDQRAVGRPQGPACDAGAVERDYRLLTAAKAGTGTGTVSATGINCGGDCSESFVDSSAVVLTATADAGSTFTGWTGCDGVAGNQCTQTLSSPSETVTATFTANPPPSTGGGSTPITTPAPTTPPAPKKCTKGQKLKKGKCVKKKRKKK